MASCWQGSHVNAARRLAHLVVDDVPGVGHQLVVLPGECMVAHARGSKGVAAQPDFQALLSSRSGNVMRSQLRKRSAQRVPCKEQPDLARMQGRVHVRIQSHFQGLCSEMQLSPVFLGGCAVCRVHAQHGS